MRLTTLRQIVAAADARARSVGGESSALSRRPDAQLAVCDVALDAIKLMLAEIEQPRGWERVAMTLSDLRERLPVDALDIEVADQARRRLSLLGSLPEISGFSSQQDIASLVGETIAFGAPRYNSGDIRGCAALYWMIIRLIYETPATRGFPGYARLQGQLKPFADVPVPATVLGFNEVDAWAWELRRALDSAAQSPAS